MELGTWIMLVAWSLMGVLWYRDGNKKAAYFCAYFAAVSCLRLLGLLSDQLHFIMIVPVVVYMVALNLMGKIFKRKQ